MMVHRNANGMNKAIILQPLDGGPARKLMEAADFLFWFDFSLDGKQLAYTSTRDLADLVVINTSN
jgi:Tol biopolymer transport system component